jgi:WD40 repeat protein
VASGAYDGAARLWRWDGSLIATFDPNMGPVQALAFDTRRHALWVGTFSGSVACFDLATRQQSMVFRGHVHSIRTLALCAEGRFLLVGDDNGLLVVRDLATHGTIVHRVPLSGTAYRAMFDADGTILVTTSAGVCRYRVRGTQPLQCYPVEHPRWFSVLDDGNLCALSLYGELRVFEPGTGRCVAHSSIDDPRPHRLVLALGPQRILTAGGDGVVRCYDQKLDRLAQMHHQYRGVLWTTRPRDTHPGWLFTDRPDLIEIGTEQGGMREAWTPDARRERHLMVFNSATHVMQVVNGMPSSGPGPQSADRYLPGSAMGTKQLIYRAGLSDAKPGLT